MWIEVCVKKNMRIWGDRRRVGISPSATNYFGLAIDRAFELIAWCDQKISISANKMWQSLISIIRKTESRLFEHSQIIVTT